MIFVDGLGLFYFATTLGLGLLDWESLLIDNGPHLGSTPPQYVRMQIKFKKKFDFPYKVGAPAELCIFSLGKVVQYHELKLFLKKWIILEGTFVFGLQKVSYSYIKFISKPIFSRDKQLV